jgi:RNA-directed DNA polymerase
MVKGTREHAEALRAEAATALAPLGLRLAEEKTRIVHIDEGFDSLGFTIRRMRKRGTNRHYACTVPSRKAIQAIKDKVTAMTHRSALYQDLATLPRRVNQEIFSKIDHHAWNRLMPPPTATTPATRSGR